MKHECTTGVRPACGATTRLYRSGISQDSMTRSSATPSRTHSAGAPKTVLLLLAAFITLVSAGGCSETPVTAPDRPATRFNVYFNNDSLTDGKTVCDAVFPVARSSPSTTRVASAALEALFLGPTPEERLRGYRSFFSERTAGLLKRLKIKAGTAYVDLQDRRRELAGATSSCGSAEFFSQIRRTLGEFPTIERVIFAIEGNPEVFYDWMELECDRSNDNCDPGHFAPPAGASHPEPGFPSGASRRSDILPGHWLAYH